MREYEQYLNKKNSYIFTFPLYMMQPIKKQVNEKLLEGEIENPFL